MATNNNFFGQNGFFGGGSTGGLLGNQVGPFGNTVPTLTPDEQADALEAYEMEWGPQDATTNTNQSGLFGNNGGFLGLGNTVPAGWEAQQQAEYNAEFGLDSSTPTTAQTDNIGISANSLTGSPTGFGSITSGPWGDQGDSTWSDGTALYHNGTPADSFSLSDNRTVYDWNNDDNNAENMFIADRTQDFNYNQGAFAPNQNALNATQAPLSDPATNFSLASLDPFGMNGAGLVVSGMSGIGMQAGILNSIMAQMPAGPETVVSVESRDANANWNNPANTTYVVDPTTNKVTDQTIEDYNVKGNRTELSPDHHLSYNNKGNYTNNQTYDAFDASVDAANAALNAQEGISFDNPTYDTSVDATNTEYGQTSTAPSENSMYSMSNASPAQMGSIANAFNSSVPEATLAEAMSNATASLSDGTDFSANNGSNGGWGSNGGTAGSYGTNEGSEQTSMLADQDAGFWGDSDAGDGGGGGGGGGGGDSYIATAATQALGEEGLSVFEEWRDYMFVKYPTFTTSYGRYRVTAPKIVKAIDSKDNSKELYKEIWDNHLKPIFNLISKDKDSKKAQIDYKIMVRNLQKRFLK